MSAADDDNPDIVCQMDLLYARTNMLIQNFSKCDINVKFCLFELTAHSFIVAQR